MSLPIKMTVQCPKCRHSFQAMAYRSINTDLQKDLPKKIISGEFFNAPCPRCKFVAHLQYNVLYNDLRHKAMIWVISPEMSTYEMDLREARASLQASQRMGCMTRIVNDMDALREKVACLESGRDDRIVELIKPVLALKVTEDYPDFVYEKAFYTLNKGNEIVFLYGKAGQEYQVVFPDDAYRIIEKQYKERIDASHDDLAPIIDDKWAKRFLGGKVDDDLPEDDTIEANQWEDESDQEENDSFELPPIRFCRKCGKELLPDSVFCSYCGTRVLR